LHAAATGATFHARPTPPSKQRLPRLAAASAGSDGGRWGIGYPTLVTTAIQIGSTDVVRVVRMELNADVAD